MARAIYFDAFSGISGDMTLGALLHAGLPFGYLESELDKLGLSSAYSLVMHETNRSGISGIKLEVQLSGIAQYHRSLSEIISLISSSALKERAKIWAIAIFERLARAEAKIHQVSPEQVHFHEVGAVDAIVDIVGSCVGFEYFKLEEFYCSMLPSGSGFTRSEHGLLPVPAPATLELLISAGATLSPSVTLSGGIEYPARAEMVTPTGAAIAAVLCRFERPAFKLERSGYGFGSREFEWPNALRIWIGESLVKQLEKSLTLNTVSAHSHPYSITSGAAHHHLENEENHAGSDLNTTGPVEFSSTNPEMHPHHFHLPDNLSDLALNGSVINDLSPRGINRVTPETPGKISLLETNLDDMTPEGLGYLLEKLLAEGALDVFFTPIQMKKNRPATMLSVSTRCEDEERLANLILRESSSFGVRVARLDRYIAGREFSEVEVPWGKARVKTKMLEGEKIEVVPEYDSVAELARRTGKPWREVYEEIKKALRDSEA